MPPDKRVNDALSAIIFYHCIERVHLFAVEVGLAIHSSLLMEDEVRFVDEPHNPLHAEARTVKRRCSLARLTLGSDDVVSIVVHQKTS